jgi:ubiquinone/menaquinone biosynthesis C-methylase UbiE
MIKEDSNIQFWKRVAKLYTPIIEKKNKQAYEKLCSMIKPLLSKNMQVLELACGTGQLTFSLCDNVGYWEATDFSEKMIEETKKRNKKEIVKFSVQDATNLTYTNEQFDVVVIANALHIMPDPDKALSEIKRVMKKEGLLIAPTYVYDGNVNKIMIFLMERIGFKTFHKWKSSELKAYVESKGFSTIKLSLIQGKILPECLLVGKK